MITRRDLVAASMAGGLVAGIFAVSSFAQGPPAKMESTVWHWKDLEAKPTAVGERRDVVRRPTITLDELEMHVTTLKPRTASHPPHTHPNEELIIIKEGTLEAHVNGKEIVVGPGSILFFASMQPHGVKNIGDTQATYHVINWVSPSTPKAPAAAPTR